MVGKGEGESRRGIVHGEGEGILDRKRKGSSVARGVSGQLSRSPKMDGFVGLLACFIICPGSLTIGRIRKVGLAGT